MKSYRKIQFVKHAKTAALAELRVRAHLTLPFRLLASEDASVKLKVSIRITGQPVGTALTQEYSVIRGVFEIMQFLTYFPTPSA